MLLPADGKQVKISRRQAVGWKTSRRSKKIHIRHPDVGFPVMMIQPRQRQERAAYLWIIENKINREVHQPQPYRQGSILRIQRKIFSTGSSILQRRMNKEHLRISRVKKAGRIQSICSLGSGPMKGILRILQCGSGYGRDFSGRDEDSPFYQRTGRAESGGNHIHGEAEASGCLKEQQNRNKGERLSLLPACRILSCRDTACSETRVQLSRLVSDQGASGPRHKH